MKRNESVEPIGVIAVAGFLMYLWSSNPFRKYTISSIVVAGCLVLLVAAWPNRPRLFPSPWKIDYTRLILEIIGVGAALSALFIGLREINQSYGLTRQQLASSVRPYLELQGEDDSDGVIIVKNKSKGLALNVQLLAYRSTDDFYYVSTSASSTEVAIGEVDTLPFDVGKMTRLTSSHASKKIPKLEPFVFALKNHNEVLHVIIYEDVTGNLLYSLKVSDLKDPAAGYRTGYVDDFIVKEAAQRMNVK